MSDIDVKEEMDLEMDIVHNSYRKYVFEELAVKEEHEELQKFCENDDEDMAIIKDPLYLDGGSEESKSSTEAKKNLLNKLKPKPKVPNKSRRKLTRQWLQKTERKQEPQRRTKCEDCDRVFLTEKLLRHYHEKLPPSEDGPKCKPKRKRRKKNVTRLSRPISERKRRRLRNRVKCEDCGIVFGTDNALKNHQKLPPSEDGIKCKECSAIFKRITCLTYHVEDIHPSYARLRMPSLYYGRGRGLDKLKCPDCHKVYTQSYGLRRHLGTASLKINNEPVKCDECNMSFVLSNCLKYHIQRKHPNLVPHLVKPKRKSASDSVADILCEECGKSFPESAYLYHMNTHHKDMRPLYSCSVCKKSFDSEDVFCLHKEESPACITVKNIHKCPDCSKTFASKENMKRHAKIHTTEKEKPYRCEICGLSYNQKHSLKTHTLTHTGEKPFSCTFCGKKFAASSGLENHKLIHPEVRRAMLEKCAKMLGINENNDT